ncbi:hypothetical protein ACFV8T_24935 [Streptomyces sp. NPDC059832]|uniref:hypothetical protein n=1 Tax=Streptomyces sp. NPDC059832 TaxID=3346966 RepID=UPI0036673605
MSHEAATDRGPTTQPDLGPNDGKVRKNRLRLLAIGAAAGATLAVGGILVVTSIMGDDSRPQLDARTSPSPEGDKPSEPPGQEFTPATARARALLQPDSTAEGIGTGFEHSALGAASAAVSYWQGFDLRDEEIARKQWTAVTSKGSPETIDRGVSGLVGAPDWGEVPNEGSAVVKAILERSLNGSGDVVVVWMVYDRLAAGGHGESLEDETTYLILKWEDGDWKVTEEPQYATRVGGPRAYHPDSKWAFSDGWRRVARG